MRGKSIIVAVLAAVIFAGLFLGFKNYAPKISPSLASEENLFPESGIIRLIKAAPDSAAPFPTPVLSSPTFPGRVCDIKNYGALSGGKILNTQAFQKAIADCAKKGGGKVEVPSGTWLTGAIHLKSNVDLDLAKGATIKFSTHREDYLPVVFSRFEGIELYNYSPFIYANGQENIAVTGQGELDGQGNVWWNRVSSRQKASIVKLNLMAKNNLPVSQRVFGPNGALQPAFLEFIHCRNVVLAGITIINSPRWTIHPVYSENVKIKNVNVNTSREVNADGIDIDSSRNVLVENSKFNTGDDAIVVKSGADQDGQRVKKPSQDIVIRNCEVDGGHGAFAIGSEMSGGVKNVFVDNLTVRYADYGLRFKSVVGRGGTVENVWTKNINVSRAGAAAIQFNLSYRPPDPGANLNTLPIFKNINIENFYCRHAKTAVELLGLPKSPLENITLKNAVIYARRGLEEKNVTGKNFQNVKIITN